MKIIHSNISWVLDAILYCMFIGVAIDLLTSNYTISGYIALLGSFFIIRKEKADV